MNVLSIQFPPLVPFPWLIHGFILRQNGIDVQANRTQVLLKLKQQHDRILRSYDIETDHLCIAEQVHGNQVVSMSGAPSITSLGASHLSVSGVDGLVTNKIGIPLGVYTADCCAVFLVETQQRAIGLLHSGKKGTALNIVHEGVSCLKKVCNRETSHIIAALSPCIHSCCYEIDFVSKIEEQLRAEGVSEIWRHEDCTGCHIDRYYSYRKEKGETGRMLAFMVIR